MKHLLLHCRGCWKAAGKKNIFLYVLLDSESNYFVEINSAEAEVWSSDRQKIPGSDSEARKYKEYTKRDRGICEGKQREMEREKIE